MKHTSPNNALITSDDADFLWFHWRIFMLSHIPPWSVDCINWSFTSSLRWMGEGELYFNESTECDVSDCGLRYIGVIMSLQ